ncbi:MAG: hypothetical protein L6V95_04045 [Candidatus Melainabacteria bacterium]|nr:MAG: hypothetical protein L6V95_04045 [Candidatus Melainabacteria bacterium]
MVTGIGNLLPSKINSADSTNAFKLIRYIEERCKSLGIDLQTQIDTVKTAAVNAKVNIFKNLEVRSLTDTNEFNKYKLSKEELDLLTNKSVYVDKLSDIVKNTGVKSAEVKTAANAQIVMLTDPTKVKKRYD